MKKGFLASVAICSLLLMAACGGNGTAKEAAAETKTTAEQPADKAAEPKTETEAAPAAETEPAAEKPAVESESAGPAKVSQADEDLATNYMEQLSPVIESATPTFTELSTYSNSWLNGELSDAEMREQLVTTKAAFTMLKSEFTKTKVPQVEYAPLHDALSEFHSIVLGMGVDGGKSMDLFLEAIDEHDEVKLDQAYDSLEIFDEYVTRMETVYADLKTMVDVE